MHSNDSQDDDDCGQDDIKNEDDKEEDSGESGGKPGYNHSKKVDEYDGNGNYLSNFLEGKLACIRVDLR